MGQSVATKEKLLEAGKNVIFRKGFNKARVSDITSQAGLAHGTFYLYFKTKEDFLLELLSSVRGEIISLIEEGVRLMSEGKLDEGKELAFLRSFELMVREKELAKIFFFEAICSSGKFQSFYREGKEMFQERIEEALSHVTDAHHEVKVDILLGTARHLIEDLILSGREVMKPWREVLKELGVYS